MQLEVPSAALSKGVGVSNKKPLKISAESLKNYIEIILNDGLQE